MQKKLVRDTLRSILDSPQFSKSRRYPALLEYIVVHTLSGESQGLKERILAAEVFDRQPDYDSSTDSTVRTIASEVRRRMAAYFSEHPESPVRIGLPLGGYVAEFKFPAPVPDETVPETAGLRCKALSDQKVTNIVASDPELRRLIGHNAMRSVSAFATVLVAVAGLLFWNHSRNLNRQSFWWPVLHNHVPAVVVVGGGPDAGNSPVGSNALAADALTRSSYENTFGDMVAVATVCDGFRSLGRDCSITPAQSAASFRNESVVLIGGFDNVLTNRFLSTLRYQFRSIPPADSSGTGTGALMIVDTTNPAQDRSWGRPFSPGVRANTDYALLARFHTNSTDGDVVVIAGLTGDATASAARYAASLERMRETVARAPKGWGGLNFEAVLQIEMIGGEPGHTRVVAAHFW